MAAHEFSAETLRELFAYDPTTGVLSYRTHVWPHWIGRPVSCDVRRGYKRVRVRRKWLLIHRVAWVIQTGQWPEMIDHINGCRDDNRWANLREADKFLNAQNRTKAERGNKAGLLGAHKRQHGGFTSHITCGGKRTYLGTFATSAEAQAAYMSAKRALHPHSFLAVNSPQTPHEPESPSEFGSCRGGHA